MAKRKRKNRLFGITSRVLMLIVAALLALSYLSIVINPAQVWMVSLSGLMFVPLMTLNMVLLFWAFIEDPAHSSSLCLPSFRHSSSSDDMSSSIPTRP